MILGIVSCTSSIQVGTSELYRLLDHPQLYDKAGNNFAIANQIKTPERERTTL